MDAVADELPAEPFIKSAGTIFTHSVRIPARAMFTLAMRWITNSRGDRFSDEGKGLDSMKVGITPNSFCYR